MPASLSMLLHNAPCPGFQARRSIPTAGDQSQACREEKRNLVAQRSREATNDWSEESRMLRSGQAILTQTTPSEW